MRVLRVSHSAVVDAWRDRERELEKLGVEVTLVSSRRWNEGGFPVTLVPREGEKVHPVATIGSHPAVFLYDPRQLWRLLAQPWDVIDIHEEPFSLAIAEVLLLKLLRRQPAPYVFYSAQNIFKRFPIPFRWIELWSVRHAAGAYPCSNAIARILRVKGMRGPIRVIPLGLDPELFRPDKGDLAEPDNEVVDVGYVGRLERHKGLDVLFEAIERDPALHLRLAGAGSREPRLQRWSRNPFLAGRVQFLGPLHQQELPAFYRSVDVIAIPSLTTRSWKEQFGRVAAEEIACGTPVVSSDSGALPELVAGAGTVVPERNPARLAAALAGYRGRRHHAGHRAVDVSHLAWRSVARAQLRLYEEARAHLRTGRPARIDLPDTRAAAPPLEVVVVAYGRADLLSGALEPLQGVHVIVVDNSSSAQVREVAEAAGADYVDPGRNLGFAAGVNEALRHRRHVDSDVLLLNPDARIAMADIVALQDRLAADPTLASVAPSQHDAAGAPARVTWPLPRPAWSWLWSVGLARLAGGPTYVVGSILLIRGAALADVGGFDERLFLYAEETDWAKRAVDRGWRHQEVTGIDALHLGGATSTDPVRREQLFHASQERFMRKHFRSLGWNSVRAAVVLGTLARMPFEPRDEELRRRLRLYVDGPVRTEARRRASG